MRLAFLFMLVVCVAVLPACKAGVNQNNPTTPVTSVSLTGAWAGTATDSSGSTMGSGVSNGTLMTWQLTQTNNQVAGNITFAGLTPIQGQAQATVSGTVSSDNVFTFTVTIPAGLVSTFPGCSATASGSMALNATGTTLTGTYTGSGACTGAINNGQITLTRQ